jgi:hypothetical protein
MGTGSVALLYNPDRDEDKPAHEVAKRDRMSRERTNGHHRPAPGNQLARTHGFYSKYLTPLEDAEVEEIARDPNPRPARRRRAVSPPSSYWPDRSGGASGLTRTCNGMASPVAAPTAHAQPPSSAT